MYEVPNKNKSLDMQRRSLPQIDLKALLKDKDFLISKRSLRTKDLIPTQKHFNDDKVNGMIAAHESGKMAGKPFGGVIVSKDNYIIDGHHRALAAHNTTGAVDVVQIDDNIDDALEKFDKKDYVVKKKLNESVLTLEEFMAEANKKTTKKKEAKPAQEVNFEPTLDDTLVAGTDATINPDRAPAEASKKLTEAVKPFTYEKQGNSWIARSGKTVVGKASAWHDWDNKFVIQDVAVKSTHRRKGVATGLYNAIEQHEGKPLSPATSLSDDAFHFWKKFRPDAVAHDLRHHKEVLMGKEIEHNGKQGRIVSVGQNSATLQYHGEGGTQSTLSRKHLSQFLPKD